MLLALSITTFAVYLPGLNGGFFLDDIHVIVDNEPLKVNSMSVSSLGEAALSSESGVLYRPLSMLSFAINYYMSGMNAAAYKVVNLVIHILNAMGVFVLTYSLVGTLRKTRDIRLPEQQVRHIALLTAFVWALHPINLTSVLYVVQRMTSLSALFMLIALIVYLYMRNRRYWGRVGTLRAAIGIVILWALALLTKETGALLVLYVLVIELVVFRFRDKSGGLDRNLVTGYIIIFSVLGSIAAGILSKNPDVLLGGYDMRDYTLWERLMTETRVIMLYLQMIVLPSNALFGIYHDDIALSTNLLNPITTLTSTSLLILSIAIAIQLRKKQPVITFAILWFLVGHLLESTVLPLELAHEHRNYLPSYGPIMCAAFYLLRALSHLRHARMRGLITLLPVLLLAVMTALRADQWGDYTRHTIMEAVHHPGSARATYSVGRLFANRALAGRYQEAETAIDYMKAAIKMNKKTLMPNVAMAVFCEKMRLNKCAQWFEDARAIAATKPVTPETITAMQDLIDCNRNECKNLEPQTETLLKELAKNPHVMKQRVTSADIQVLLGQHQMYKTNDFSAAEPSFKRALELAPQIPKYNLNLARLYIAMGNIRAAKRYLHDASRMDRVHRYENEIHSLEAQVNAYSK